VSGRAAALLGGLVLLVTPAVSAQETPSHEGRHSEERASREAAFRMVDAYIVANLKESLGLTEETYVKAIPLVKELQSARRDYFIERGRDLRQLRSLLRSGGATRDEVLAALEAVKKIDLDGPERIHRASSALDAVLSPMEQAKYRVLELEVEHRMRELMGRARRERVKPKDAPR
jgi:hypothetical protein